ncbi:hypothetical protein H6P81_020895 [Aristolochia fimbriata]|uniref:Reticulon-like protein n=1 Tax=Aristolochia fimbriata TaxID=158543 RepID=A0AAV7DVR0_ARIFI|nr:hypothetical protein H6P81_020895 [Aristolochia fimbriata]
MSSAEQEPALPTRDTLTDIFLWRKKKLSVAVLLISTLMYVALEIYLYRFLPLLCWALMAVFLLAFLGASLLKIVGKEGPNFSGLEVSEESTLEAARKLKAWIEDWIRWMFVISVEREWIEFARVVVGLYLLSLVGRQFNFLTVVYIGGLLGCTIPIIYTKNQDKIRSWTERVKMQGQRWFSAVKEKMGGMKGKMVSKEKKVE